MIRQAYIIVSLGLAAPALADPAEDWSGRYWGGSLNFATGETTIIGNRFTYNQNQAENRVEHSYEGAGISGFLGTNRQRGAFVYGGEASLAFSDLSSGLVFNTDNDIDQVEIDWSGTLSGRLGYVVSDTLIYAKGGVTVANVRNIGGDVNGGALTLSDAHNRSGPLYGATVAVGAERLIGKNTALRVEFSHTRFDAYAEANEDGVPGSQVYRVRNGPVQTLSLGLTLKF